MRTILYVVATSDGLDLRVGEEANLPNLGAVLMTFDIPVSRLIDGIPELREHISILARERDEARAEMKRLRAVMQDLYDVLEGCLYDIDEKIRKKVTSNE